MPRKRGGVGWSQTYEAYERSGNPGTRNRYVGRGRKGKPTNAQTDGFELRIAASELEGARQALVAAHAMPEGIERREAVRAAVGKLALVTRAIDEVVIRRGGECGDVAA